MMAGPNSPTFCWDHLPLHWQMPRADKFALVALLQAIRPKVAVEIGTYRGGSLQLISQFSESVHSIDINRDSQEALRGRFSNVTFHIGSSPELLPGLLREAEEELEFVLVDGDHSAQGVGADLAALLRHVPKRPLWIACHDSFNPECRRGMLSAEWEANPHVTYVELDFVGGVFHRRPFDTAKTRSMWGGLCLAHLSPESRTGALKVHQSQDGLFRWTYFASRHLWVERRKAILRRLLGRRSSS